MEALLMIIGTLFIIPIIILYSSFSWGFVATIVYKWFILPIFPEFHVFTWIEFAGIMFFVNCFIHKGQLSIKKEYKDQTQEWMNLIINPWVALVGAWILHLFY